MRKTPLFAIAAVLAQAAFVLRRRLPAYGAVALALGAFPVQFVWTGQAGDLLFSTVVGVLVAAVVVFEFGA